MSKWSAVWPRGVPKAPALRIGRAGIRITQELYEAMDQPSLVNIVLGWEGAAMLIGLKHGNQHRVTGRAGDHAYNVNSRPLARKVPRQCYGRWWYVDEDDGVWATQIIVGATDD